MEEKTKNIKNKKDNKYVDTNVQLLKELQDIDINENREERAREILKEMEEKGVSQLTTKRKIRKNIYTSLGFIQKIKRIIKESLRKTIPKQNEKK